MDGVVNIQKTNATADYINIPSKKPCINNKDPYSIYDDDSSATHYFLVPPIKDPQKFTRAFQELNKIGTKPSICRTNNSTCSSGYINERNLRRTQSQRTRTKSCTSMENNATRHLRTTNFSQHKIPPPPPKRIERGEEEDYCTIKVDSKIEYNPSNRPSCILSSANTRIKKQCIKREHPPEFSLNKTHDFGGDHDCSCKTKTQRSDPDRYIDICTCMLCVRSVSYKYSGKESEDEKIHSYSEPCSCKNTTTTSKSVGRYVCMGLMAVFLPCMLCYFPAKACSRSRKSKHKHYSDDTLVYYQTNNNKPL